MKKLMLVMAVLMIATPALAAVTLTCAQNGKEVTVSYNATAGAPRAFALDISVDSGQTIVSVDTSDSNSSYWVYPGSIDINPATGGVDDYGQAVCDSAYPGTLGGLNTSGITVEMGSLYEGAAPASSGILLKYTVATETDCVATMVVNSIRGGIVMEDPNEDPVATLDSPFDIGFGCGTCLGDVDGNGWIRTTDLSALANILIAAGSPYRIPSTDPLWNPCGDMDSNTWLRTTDLSALANILIAAGSPYRIQCPVE